MIKSFKHIGEYSSNLMTETPTSSTTTITTKGEIMGKMKRKPTHPGEILKADYLVSPSAGSVELAALRQPQTRLPLMAAMLGP
jgi:hypothetical protein